MMKRVRGEHLLLAVGLLATLNGCVVYTTEVPPAYAEVLLPVQAPVWSTVTLETPSAHDATIAEVVSATGVCGDATAERALYLVFSKTGRTHPVGEFFAGFTFTTYPLIQRYDLALTGDLRNAGGTVLAQVTAKSTVTVAMSWVFVVVPWMWRDMEGTALVDEHVRQLTRYVVAGLVDANQHLAPTVAPEPELPVIGGESETVPMIDGSEPSEPSTDLTPSEDTQTPPVSEPTEPPTDVVPPEDTQVPPAGDGPR